MQRIGGLFEALSHQETADGKEHEHPCQPEDRLVPGQQDQRLVILGALCDQKRMREDDRNRVDQTQRIEIVLSARHSYPQRMSDVRHSGRLPSLSTTHPFRYAFAMPAAFPEPYL